MNDLFGLIFVALLIAGMGLFCSVKLRRYRPYCEHGKEWEKPCEDCDRRADGLTERR